MSTTLVHRSRTSGRSILQRLGFNAEHGMTTAEYAVGTVGACALAAIILMLADKGGFFDGLIQNVLTAAFNRGK